MADVRIHKSSQGYYAFYYECYKCGSEMKVPLEHEGKMVKCRECGFKHQAPTSSDVKKEKPEVNYELAEAEEDPVHSYADPLGSLQDARPSLNREGGTRRKDRKKKNNVPYIVIPILLIGVAFGVLYLVLNSSGPSGDSGTGISEISSLLSSDGGTPVSTTFREFVDTYTQNMAAGDEKYKGSKIELWTGFEKIGSNKDGRHAYIIDGNFSDQNDWGFKDIIVYFNSSSDLAKINVYDDYKIQGKVVGIKKYGLINAVVIKNAVIIEMKKVD